MYTNLLFHLNSLKLEHLFSRNTKDNSCFKDKNVIKLNLENM